MQLLLGVHGAWKCLEVTLAEGHAPTIGGTTLAEHNMEPAQWFKVLVLDSICVDCSERVISWSASEGSTTNFAAQTITKSSQPDNSPSPSTTPGQPSSWQTPNRELATHTSINQFFQSLSLSSRDGGRGGGRGGGEAVAKRHTLMAPHDGDCSLCTDDLQALFELAELLYRVNNAASPLHGRGLDVEQRSWLKLLHCYLLPLVSFDRDDVVAMETASSAHYELMAPLDESIAAIAAQSMKIKEGLSQLEGQLLPIVERWAESGQCDHTFLAKLTSALRRKEEDLRSKIYSASKSLELSKSLSMPVASGLEQRFLAEQREGESLLLQSLHLRGLLEATLHTATPPVSMEMTEEVWRLQRQYVQLHTDLESLREKAALLSRKKVLALSVREALEQTRDGLQRGLSATTGQDRGKQGGCSTDVLPEASQYSESAVKSEYLTLRDQIQQLLTQQPGSVAAGLHDEFCSRVKEVWFPFVQDDFVLVGPLPRTATLPATLKRQHSSPDTRKRRFSDIMKRLSPGRPSTSRRQATPLVSGDASHDLTQLVLLVREHFEKMTDAICRHFHLPHKDSHQRVWLCYEKLFFQTFSKDFLSLYKKSNAKACEQLEMSALAVSMLDPASLNLGVAEPSWLQLFPPRSYEEASALYQELASSQPVKGESPSARELRQQQGQCSSSLEQFSSVVSDLVSVPLVPAPLEKLQLLTSAFRKLMAVLSQMKLRTVIQPNSEADATVVDLSVGVVSCDDLLPVLVLLLLHLPPSTLTLLHLHTTLTADYIAPFLSPGWHGYSLAAFQSALQIITQL